MAGGSVDIASALVETVDLVRGVIVEFMEGSLRRHRIQEGRKIGFKIAVCSVTILALTEVVIVNWLGIDEADKAED